MDTEATNRVVVILTNRPSELTHRFHYNDYHFLRRAEDKEMLLSARFEIGNY